MSATETAIWPAPALWKRYAALTKPRIVALMVFTAWVGMLLSADGAVGWPRIVFGLLGIALASASGAAFNHIIDRRIDGAMERTRHRPLPSGSVETAQALLFAATLGISAVVILAVGVNALTALLTAGAMIGYAVVYTAFLKRTTPQNVVWGGAAGAAPPLLGAVAVTGEITTQAILLFLIVFIWTPPHFWPLAIHRQEEYARVNLPMLPLTHGVRFTKSQVLIYTFMLLSVSLLPFASGLSGWFYLGAALPLGAGFIYHAFRFYRSDGDGHAMATFRYSIWYLFLLFAALIVDRYVEVMRAGTA